MDNNPSRRHHYLPQFYLRGFTAEAGHFYIFEKHIETIKKGCPKEYFFRWDKRAFRINKTEDEKKFGYIEYVQKNKKLYISATTRRRHRYFGENYGNDIINVVKSWSTKRHD